MNFGNNHPRERMQTQCFYRGAKRSFTIEVSHFGASDFGMKDIPVGSWREMWVSDPPYALSFMVGGGGYGFRSIELSGTFGEIHDRLLQVEPMRLRG